jgi:hypothetical protein
MMRQLLPISVHPPALVRAMDRPTYSRMAVSAPFRTPDGVSVAEFQILGPAAQQRAVPPP